MAHAEFFKNALLHSFHPRIDRILNLQAKSKDLRTLIKEREDGLAIEGTGGGPLLGGGPIATHLDHRIAMSMAVAGLASRDGVEVDDTRPIATSFPTFETLISDAAA